MISVRTICCVASLTMMVPAFAGETYQLNIQLEPLADTNRYNLLRMPERGYVSSQDGVA